jgi:PadR family transcriptional regulator AphA
MNYQTISNHDRVYVKCISADTPLSREQDALDLITLCAENDTNLLMLHGGALSEDFFNLRTRIAGGIMQKLTSYNVTTALILDEMIHEGRFKELAAESNKGQHFRIFDSSAEGENWLLGRE